ncbi:uncharacterized protein LOC128174743 [Crassostrea angulata]|uniref:uncharacterized protein LOC128174743 n=1 Tax=Magallana angulata TaxID=2784310 RepID=UPI0022B1A36D|nr:uncharacterized protein LOC128174743 [Crassostrea angulata]
MHEDGHNRLMLSNNDDDDSINTFFLCGYCGLLFDDDNEGQRHESEHGLHHDGVKGATSHSKNNKDQEHHCHHCDKVMSNEQDLMCHELAHDLDQMDYSGKGPWSPLIPNSTCEPMEEDHVADQEMTPDSMETDEASTSTRTNTYQIGFGGVKKIPYTIQKVGERTIMKNNAIDINYNIRLNAENPEQGMRLTDLLRELEDMFDNILNETARRLDLFLDLGRVIIHHMGLYNPVCQCHYW